MKFLLDTHALLWWLADDSRLSSTASGIIMDPSHEIHVSAVSAWEVATKYKSGKLPTGNLLLPDFSRVVAEEGFGNIPVTSDHMVQSVLLPGSHKDPFDRILAAQAMLESMTLLTTDAAIANFGVLTRW